jgi:hypothetical protein
MTRAPARRRRTSGARLALALALLAPVACDRFGRSTRAPQGANSQTQTTRYIRRAIRQSSEGVILLPSQRAQQVYELPRLNEIAQGLRAPAARCFLARAIQTMEPDPKGDRGYSHVPEGQIKIRVRIAPSGEALRTEVLESGFLDEHIEPCLRDALEQQRWPSNKTGNGHFVDVVYWVSLGMQKGLGSDEMNAHLRREQVTAGRRAKTCLQGRVDVGRYEIHGLNLVDREGATMANRIDTGDLPEAIRTCLATAFREIRLPRDADAFVRPVAPVVTFDVGDDGMVAVDGERWLELVELEERARLAAEREALAADGSDDELIDELPAQRPEQGAPGLSAGTIGAGSPGALQLAPSNEPRTDPPPADPDAPVGPAGPAEQGDQTPRQDPGKGGLRLDLGGRRRGDDA